jgi:hypothetical protein
MKKVTDILGSTPETCTECSSMMLQAKEIEEQTFFDKYLRIIESSPKYSYNPKVTDILASHTTQIGDLKLHIYEAFDIPPSEQQLTWDERELDDDTKLLSHYNVTPSKPIYVKKNATKCYWMTPTKVTSSDTPVLAQSQNHKERGFEGSILTSTPANETAPPEITWPQCRYCTFINDHTYNKKCSMCGYDNS